MAGLIDDASSAEQAQPQSPFCRDLRSKKFFFLQAMPMTSDDIVDVTGHCWCRRTMRVVGPDDHRVHPELCHADRGCYKSQFD